MGLRTRIIKRKDYIYSVELTGSIDTGTYQKLEEELKEILEAPTKAVIFDMKGVDYLSSIGVKVILETKKKAEVIDAAFSMVNLQPQIKKVFEIIKALPSQGIFKNIQELDDYLDTMQQKALQGED